MHPDAVIAITPTMQSLAHLVLAAETDPRSRRNRRSPSSRIYIIQAPAIPTQPMSPCSVYKRAALYRHIIQTQKVIIHYTRVICLCSEIIYMHPSHPALQIRRSQNVERAVPTSNPINRMHVGIRVVRLNFPSFHPSHHRSGLAWRVCLFLPDAQHAANTNLEDLQ